PIKISEVYVVKTGILPDAEIASLFSQGSLKAERPLDDDQIQPASLDLRLGNVAYRVRASFLPGPRSLVSEKLDRLKLHEISLDAGAVLETGCVYIVPLMESLQLPEDVSASANPKSSTGRLDIFTRDRKSTRLNSSHVKISYAVFCLRKNT